MKKMTRNLAALYLLGDEPGRPARARIAAAVGGEAGRAPGCSMDQGRRPVRPERAEAAARLSRGEA